MYKNEDIDWRFIGQRRKILEARASGVCANFWGILRVKCVCFNLVAYHSKRVREFRGVDDRHAVGRSIVPLGGVALA